MIAYNLKDDKFYKELTKRGKKDSIAQLYSGLLIAIEADAQHSLEYIRMVFPSYTEHNIQHSWRILNCISNIVSKDALKELTSTELFCLIFSVLFHDMGMVNHKDDKDTVRRLHPKYSAEPIKKYFETRLTILSDYSDRLANYISFIAESHGMDWNIMVESELFKKKDKISNDLLRPSILAIFLRLGDLLDLDSERSNDFFLNLCPDLFKEGDSLLHQEHHKHVIRNYQALDKIEIEVESESKEEHQIWSSWFNYLETDILKANTYVFIGDLNKFSLPPIKTTIKKK